VGIPPSIVLPKGDKSNWRRIVGDNAGRCKAPAICRRVCGTCGHAYRGVRSGRRLTGEHEQRPAQLAWNPPLYAGRTHCLNDAEPALDPAGVLG
jgi:hypothetical protein